MAIVASDSATPAATHASGMNQSRRDRRARCFTRGTGAKPAPVGSQSPPTAPERRYTSLLRAEERFMHSKVIGYILWIFGFMGAHRFYYGKPMTGTIWFFTLGLFLIGWIVDLFLIPSMDRQAERRFKPGPINYNVAWILLTFLGIFGVHRFYLGKIFTGLIYLLTGGLLLIGVIYDYWTLNDQIDELHYRGS
jgi:TM2 domain-containing membrane protein YozV